MQQRRKISIYGAGGFGREVAWLLSKPTTSASYEVAEYIEDGAAVGRVVNGKPVVDWEEFRSRTAPGANVAIALGDPEARRKIAEKCREAGFVFPCLSHYSVEMSEFVDVGAGSIVCAGSILTVNVVIGQHVHINLDCTIGHDVRIGEFSTLSPGVHVSGNVHIGNGVYVGTGANIINGSTNEPLVIADGAVIAAGACLTRSADAYCLYAGVPAEMKKRYR